MHLLDPIAILAINMKWTEDGVHPRWICRLVDDYLRRWQMQHVDGPFLKLQEQGIGISRRFFAAATSGEILTWMQEEVERVPALPGLDAVRLFLFRAASSAGAVLSDQNLVYTWTGMQGGIPWEAIANCIDAWPDEDGCYAVVNSAGATFQYVLGRG